MPILILTPPTPSTPLQEAHPLAPLVPLPASPIPLRALQVTETETCRVAVPLPEGARVETQVAAVTDAPAAREVVPLLPVPTAAPVITAAATLQVQAGVATTQVQTGVATIRPPLQEPSPHHPLAPQIPLPASLIPLRARQVTETEMETRRVMVPIPEGARVGAKVTVVTETPAAKEVVPLLPVPTGPR